MGWLSRFFKAKGPSSRPRPGDTFVGVLSDGRTVIDLRALPEDRLTSEHAEAIQRDLSGRKGRRVLLVDVAFVEKLAETEVFMEFTTLAGRFTGQGDEVFVAHLQGTPPPDLDPATVYLLRSFALEVRPFMLVG